MLKSIWNKIKCFYFYIVFKLKIMAINVSIIDSYIAGYTKNNNVQNIDRWTIREDDPQIKYTITFHVLKTRTMEYEIFIDAGKLDICTASQAGFSIDTFAILNRQIEPLLISLKKSLAPLV